MTVYRLTIVSHAPDVQTPRWSHIGSADGPHVFRFATAAAGRRGARPNDRWLFVVSSPDGPPSATGYYPAVLAGGPVMVMCRMELHLYHLVGRDPFTTCPYVR